MNINHDSFIMIRKGLMEHLDQGKINGRELSIYTSIHFWADFRYGIAWKLSAPFLAKFLNEKETIVKKSLQSLSSKGYIKRFNHRGQRTYYPILIHNYEIQKGVYTVADKTLNSNSLCLRVDFKCTLNVLQTNFKCPLNELQVSPIKEVNNIIIKKENNTTKKVVVVENNPMTEFEKTFSNYEDMRKKIKKPLTDNAKELIIKKLKKLSIDESVQIEILNQSIMNSWQGIFPIKNDVDKKYGVVQC